VYPTFLAGLARIAPTLDMAARIAVFVNVLWSTLICIPLFAIGQAFGTRVGWLLAGGWALMPLTGYTEAIHFWQTSFYTFILTSLIAATFRLSTRSTTGHWIAYAIFGGFSLLCEPAHSFAWPIGLALLVWHRRLPWARFVLVGCVSALTILPWVVRNSLVFHAPTYIRANLGWEIDEALRNDPFDSATSRRTSPARDEGQRLEYATKGEARYLADRAAEAHLAASQSLGHVVKTAIARAWVYWTGNVQVAYLYLPAFHFVWLKYVLFTLPGIAALIAVGLGAVASRTEYQAFALLGAAFIVVFPLPYYLALTEPRYRAPIEPLLVALALLGGWHLLTRRAT
jgi:hypothetical protein